MLKLRNDILRREHHILELKQKLFAQDNDVFNI